MPAALLFLADDAADVLSGHAPLVRAARDAGFAPLLVANDHGPFALRHDLEVLLLPSPDPGRFSAIRRAAARQKVLLKILKARKPALVQLFGLGMAMLHAPVIRLGGAPRKVIALDGLGGWPDRLRKLPEPLRAPAVSALMAGLDTSATRWIVRDARDAALLGLPERAGGRLRIGGLGADPLVHVPEPMPWSPPLKVAMCGPLTATAGIALATEAVRIARQSGAEVTLSVIGARHPKHPDALPPEEAAALGRIPHVAWYAPPDDPAQIWQQHHVCLSAAGAGGALDIAALQAAGATRPAVAFAGGGTEAFLRDGATGRVVGPRSAQALAGVLAELARAPGLVERMGRAARDRLMDGFTEREMLAAFTSAWTTQAAQPDT
jgi:glycosyltransferase involved in cell wall biosynthesis